MSADLIKRDDNHDHGWLQRAATAVAAGQRVGTNENGVYVSEHVCATCGQAFTVCPPSATFGPGCLAPSCASYDPARDMDGYFTEGDAS